MAEEFKVLSDRDHVLLRPGVYLGSVTREPHSGIINYIYQTLTVVPALIKMVEEVYQNSIDHAIKNNFKVGNKIDITFNNTLSGTEITISDNGLGIPIRKIDDQYIPVLAWTTLRAGSNFDDSTRIGAGANGMGVSLVNIFSKSFIGYTSDGKNSLTVECSDNMTSINIKKGTSSKSGTSVSFTPDLIRFGLNEFTKDHIDIIKDRVVNLAILYPEIQFTFCSEKIHFKNIKDIAKRFHENAVFASDKNISLVFGPSGSDEEFRYLSYVNGIYIKNGGVHIDFILNKIIENLREHVKKKHKIDVLPAYIRQHLLFASWVTGFPSLRFDSQSKERVTNSVPEVAKVFSEIDFDKISKQILNTPDIIDPMIQAILYKKEMAEKLALQKRMKSVAKVRVVNHIAATDKDVENRSLHICEGLSAISMLVSVRDPKLHGGLPLRGKVMNVRGMKPVDIVKNKEIFELLSVIGLEFGKPATNLNYGKIRIMVDADVDGIGSIQCLLLNLFSNWPELFDQGRIYRLMTPLYICTKGKNTELFYNKADFDKFNSKGYEISYCKGLGTMSKEAYKECITNPVLVKISANDLDFDKLEMAFGNNANLRKDWMIKKPNV